MPARSLVQVDVDFPDWIGKFERSYDRIEKTVASTMQTMVGLRFDAEGASNGHERWAPLKMRQGQILSLSGDLRRSYSPPSKDGSAGPGGYVESKGVLTDFEVSIGSKLIYAAVQDRGAVITPKKKKALRFQGPNGYVFSMRSVIPARPVTDLNETDHEEIEATLHNLVTAILEGA